MTALEPTPATLKNPLLRYMLATRPAFLSAAVVAVLIGVAAAAHDEMTLNLPLALITLALAVLAHASANVLNDYYDELNGTDRLNEERIYPFTGGSRFIQNGILSAKQTLAYGLALLGITCAGGFILLFVTGPSLLWLGVPGCVLGWAYSAPPLRLNSRGLGEFCITLCFTLIVMGADLVQRQSFSLTPVLAALGYTLLATNILYINQFPDATADARTGKQHWVVRLGRARAPFGYALIALLAYGWVVAAALSKALPLLTLVACLPVPLSLKAAQILWQKSAHPHQLEQAIKLTILAALSSGALMAITLSLTP